MKPVKLVKIKTSHTSEIFQSLDIKFSFVKKIDSNTYEQVSNPIKCRDFLGDCLWSKSSGNTAYIYSFKYSYKDNPFDLDKLRLSLTFPDLESMEHFKKNFKVITLTEKDYGIAPSKWKETDCKQTLIIEASKVWQSARWKLSLFTFFIKCISYKTISDLESPEDSYIKVLSEEVRHKLMSKVKRFNKEIARDKIEGDIHYIHNYSGFVSICKNQNKEMNKLLLG